jgi:hypothetical protein
MQKFKSIKSHKPYKTNKSLSIIVKTEGPSRVVILFVCVAWRDLRIEESPPSCLAQQKNKNTS